MNDAKEKELAAREQHSVGRGVLVGRYDRLAVAVPRDDGRGFSLGLAVQRRRFVLGDELVLGVLDDSRI